LNIDIQFRNGTTVDGRPGQSDFYWHRQRNGLFDGGFNNGKSFVGCQRAFTHLMTFSHYGMVIGRQEYKVLKATTMKTFFKVCPNELILTHDKQDGYTVLKNGSFVYWMHLDDVDEQDLRGLEINSCLLDQAEEIKENIYLVLDFRVGRWDKAKVPDWLLRSQLSENDYELSLKIEKDSPKDLIPFIHKNTLWPRHPKWGHFLVPNYMDCLCNPSEEDEFHWTYRYYNPASLEKRPDHFYVHRESDENLTDSKSFQQALLRDPEWVDKYIKGKTGSPKAQIHKLDPASLINPDDFTDEEFNKFLELLRTRAALYRILDHGETGITCCLWGAAINNTHIFYREYYISSTLISVNRQNIWDLSKDEEYMADYADPQIFKKTQQSISGMKSGFQCVADEYADNEIIDAPAIYWSPADNNELATRNRLNELLVLQPRYFHPITKVSPAPGIFFIKKSQKYPFGCDKAQLQLQQQRRLLLGSDNGKNIYSDERDDSIPDHAYDCIRYYIAMHNTAKIEEKRKPPRMSFEYYKKLMLNRPRAQAMSMD
jgi:hypothetical protein